eukprot:TRINITY_DN7271_c0_g1_i1.p1 TRINITY_DN7271_c0_g1~~TRINITY_DN7271_c0_g1_i1.p1  ORF type:complete len:71 (+),score=19.21 TRINITY_DN7271_c0_g1_i1:208-420(+)
MLCSLPKIDDTQPLPAFEKTNELKEESEKAKLFIWNYIKENGYNILKIVLLCPTPNNMDRSSETAKAHRG